jgi:hypothetical protein
MLRWPLVDKDDARDCLQPAAAAWAAAAAAAAEDSARAAAAGAAAAPQAAVPLIGPPPDWNGLSYDIMYRTAETQLSLGLSAVLDCPFSRAALFQRAAALAARVRRGAGAPPAGGMGTRPPSRLAGAHATRPASCSPTHPHFTLPPAPPAPVRRQGGARGLPALRRGRVARAPRGPRRGGRRHRARSQAGQLGGPATAAGGVSAASGLLLEQEEAAAVAMRPFESAPTLTHASHPSLSYAGCWRWSMDEAAGPPSARRFVADTTSAPPRALAAAATAWLHAEGLLPAGGLPAGAGGGLDAGQRAAAGAAAVAAAADAAAAGREPALAAAGAQR